MIGSRNWILWTGPKRSSVSVRIEALIQLTAEPEEFQIGHEVKIDDERVLDELLMS